MIASLFPDRPEAEIALERIANLVALRQERSIYRRSDRNAKRILTEIGRDVLNTHPLRPVLPSVMSTDSGFHHPVAF